MAFCRNCGNQLQPQQAFCKNCGTKVAAPPQSRDQDDTILTAEPEFRSNQAPNFAPDQQYRSEQAAGYASNQPHRSGQGVKVSLSTPMKIVLAAVLVLAAGLLAVHLYLSNQFTPEKAVEGFEKAVNEKDYKELRDILQTGGTDAKLSDDALKGYVAYLTKDSDFKLIVKELKQEAEVSRFSPVTDDAGNKLVTLVKGPKKFFLYKQYAVKAYPITVKAISNLENTKVYFNGNSKVIKEPNEEVAIVKVLPGNLTLKGVYTGKFTTLNTEKKVDFSEANENILSTELQFDGKYVTIYSNGDNADIYANGKKTGMKTGSLDNFGPVPTDGSVEIYAVLDREGKILKSNTVKITGEGEVSLQFKELAEEKQKAEAQVRVKNVLAQYPGATPKEQMQSFMEEYLSRSVQAFNSRDISMLSDYLSPNGPSYAETSKYIPHLEEKGITEDFLGVEVLDMQTTDTGFVVTVRSEYNIYYVDKPSAHNVYRSTYTLEATDSGLRDYSLKTETISSDDL